MKKNKSKNKKNKKKIIIPILILVVFVAIALAIAAKFFINKNKSSGDDAVFVQKVGDLSATVITASRYKGIVENQKTIKVGFDTQRKLDETFVAVGDTVKKGDKLFSYDIEKLDLEIAQLEVEVEKFKATIENTNAQKELLQKQLASAKEEEKAEFSAQILQADADIAQAEYDIKSKENEIASKKTAVENSVVYAEVDGVVKKMATARTDENGNTSVTMEGSSDDSSYENIYIVIQEQGEFRIKGTVSEQMVQSLSVDMPVTIRSRVDTNITWAGKITAINTGDVEQSNNNNYVSSSSSSDSISSKYSFYVQPESNEGLMIGQHVTIEPDNGKDVVKEGVWLSSGYLVMDENETYVWTAASEGAPLKKTVVELGDYDESMDEWQIVSGVDEETYIAWPDEMCVEGAPTVCAMDS